MSLLQIDVVGRDELLAGLLDLDERIHRDATGEMQDVGRQLADIVRRQLHSGAFAPLTEASIDIRRRRGVSGGTPLVATGELERSIDSSATADEASAGPSVDYAGHQQFGFSTGASSMIPGKQVPPRPFALLDDSDADDIEARLTRFLLGDE